MGQEGGRGLQQAMPGQMAGAGGRGPGAALGRGRTNNKKHRYKGLTPIQEDHCGTDMELIINKHCLDDYNQFDNLLRHQDV